MPSAPRTSTALIATRYREGATEAEVHRHGDGKAEGDVVADGDRRTECRAPSAGVRVAPERLGNGQQAARLEGGQHAEHCRATHDDPETCARLFMCPNDVAHQCVERSQPPQHDRREEVVLGGYLTTDEHPEQWPRRCDDRERDHRPIEARELPRQLVPAQVPEVDGREYGDGEEHLQRFVGPEERYAGSPRHARDEGHGCEVDVRRDHRPVGDQHEQRDPDRQPRKEREDRRAGAENERRDAGRGDEHRVASPLARRVRSCTVDITPPCLPRLVDVRPKTDVAATGRVPGSRSSAWSAMYPATPTVALIAMPTIAPA